MVLPRRRDTAAAGLDRPDHRRHRRPQPVGSGPLNEPLDSRGLPAASPLDPVYLDGAYLPLAAARLSPLDRGFLFGDAVYEVWKARRGRPLFLAAHLGRLAHSLASLDIPPPAGLDAIAAGLLDRTGLLDGAIYLQVSRGVGPRRPIPPVGLAPTVFAMAFPHAFAGLRPSGWRAVSMPDPRWARCDVKTTALAGSVLGKLAARAASADEVLFVGPDGELREGGSVNVLVVERSLPDEPARLATPPLGPHLLAGVTRATLLAAAARQGLVIAEGPVSLAERGGWSELLVTGTLTGVQAVVELDGVPVCDGRPGPWARRLADLLVEAEDAELSAGPAIVRAGAAATDARPPRAPAQ